VAGTHVAQAALASYAGRCGEEVPFGQKMLLVDGEEIPLLEVRSLTITATAEAGTAESN